MAEVPRCDRSSLYAGPHWHNFECCVNPNVAFQDKMSQLDTSDPLGQNFTAHDGPLVPTPPTPTPTPPPRPKWTIMHVIVPPAGCSGPQWASLVQATESGPRWQSTLFASIRCSDTAGEATPPSLLHAALAWTWESSLKHQVELVNPRMSNKREGFQSRQRNTNIEVV